MRSEVIDLAYANALLAIFRRRSAATFVTSEQLTTRQQMIIRTLLGKPFLSSDPFVAMILARMARYLGTIEWDGAVKALRDYDGGKTISTFDYRAWYGNPRSRGYWSLYALQDHTSDKQTVIDAHVNATQRIGSQIACALADEKMFRLLQYNIAIIDGDRALSGYLADRNPWVFVSEGVTEVKGSNNA